MLNGERSESAIDWFEICQPLDLGYSCARWQIQCHLEVFVLCNLELLPVCLIVSHPYWRPILQRRCNNLSFQHHNSRYGDLVFHMQSEEELAVNNQSKVVNLGRPLNFIVQDLDLRCGYASSPYWFYFVAAPLLMTIGYKRPNPFQQGNE